MKTITRGMNPVNLSSIYATPPEGYWAGVPAKLVRPSTEESIRMISNNAQGYLMYKEWFVDDDTI
jgi:hypothetical protein